MGENYLTPELYKKFSYLLQNKMHWVNKPVNCECAIASIGRDEWQLVFDICYFGGCRIMEALNLGLQEIDWENQQIIIPAKRTKTKTPRIITISNKNFWTRMNELKCTFEDRRLIFASIAKRKTMYRYAYELTRQICDDIPELTIRHTSRKKVRQRGYTHLFRKSCGTTLLKAGMQLDDIREKLGHQNIMMTSKYLTGMGDKNRAKFEEGVFN